MTPGMRHGVYHPAIPNVLGEVAPRGSATPAVAAKPTAGWPKAAVTDRLRAVREATFGIPVSLG